LVAGLLTVAGQHYFTFWKAQERFAQDPDKLAKLHWVAPERIPPARFWEFMTWSAARGLPIGGLSASGGFAWLVWSIDGLLVLLPVMVLVATTARLPYCNRCRRWYHTTRSGRIDSSAAGQLWTLVETSLGGKFARARYRLIVCQGACGPTGLVLLDEETGGRFSSRIVWFDASGRQRVVDVLDQLTRRDKEEDAPKAEREGATAKPGDW
jgi:hypothetical protein